MIEEGNRRIQGSSVLRRKQRNRRKDMLVEGFVCLVRFLTFSSATRLYRGRVLRLTSDNLVEGNREIDGTRY